VNSDFYRRFEDKYRGTREEIKRRQRVYFSFIQPLKSIYISCNVLDLGCGRGEWLELLKESGFEAKGIDLDEGMLSACNALGLSVEKRDVITYLQSLPDKSQTVISGFHIAEHLIFSDLQKMVAEGYRVLKPGGLLILETPNPENIVVGSTTFYLDPTHQHPLPPGLLSFVMEYYGFFRVKVIRLQESEGLLGKNNPNLSEVLGGVSPDYAVVAQKWAETELLNRFSEVFKKEYGLSLNTLVERFDESRLDNQKLEEIIKRNDSSTQRFNTMLPKLDEVVSEWEKMVDEIEKVKGEQERIRSQLDAVLVDRKLVVKELQDVYNSRSYRITAPLRAIFGVTRVWRDKLFRSK
jgi:ubiquinone/menaquinone biosynthesis C-methylase UbiE